MKIEMCDRLRMLRRAKKLTQEQVAAVLKSSKNTISNHESPDGNPTTDFILKYADLYNTTTDYILGRDGSRALPVLPVSLQVLINHQDRFLYPGEPAILHHEIESLRHIQGHFSPDMYCRLLRMIRIVVAADTRQSNDQRVEK